MILSLFRGKCAICGKKASQPGKYYNAQGKPVKVCSLCIPYAERRAFRRR